MVAGLMTTAVLAGLTLSNVNTTEAHAATNDPAVTNTTTQKQNVTQDQYNEQSAVVAKDAATVNSASAVASNAQANYDSAAKAANEGSAALSDAISASKSAHQDWANKNREYQNAHKATAAANTSAANDKDYYDLWNKTEASQAAKDSNALSDAKAAKSNAQAAFSDANATWAKVQAAQKVVQDDNNKLSQSGLTSDQIEDLNDDIAGQTALINKLTADCNAQNAKGAAAAEAILGQGTTLNKDHDWILKQLDTKISLRQKKMDNHAGHQAAHDRYEGEVQAANDALSHERDLQQEVKDLKTIADSKENNIQAVRDQYNLPTDSQLARMKTDMQGAKSKLHDDQTSPIMQRVAQAQQDVKGDEAWVAARKGDVDAVNAQIKKLQDKIDAQVKKVAAATGDDKVVEQGKLDSMNNRMKSLSTNPNSTLNGVNNRLADAQTHLNNAKADLNTLLNSAEYKKVQNDIAYRQGIIDKYNQAVANKKAMKDSAAALAPLKAALDSANATLSAAQDLYNKDKAVLDNMAVNGQTPSDDHHNDQPSDHGNTGSNTGNQGNQGNAGNQNQGTTTEGNKTTTEGQKSNATVKTTQKSVATANAAVKSSKATAKKAAAKKLPQTGNNSAAVVALGALSGMLGLGLAAKKREF